MDIEAISSSDSVSNDILCHITSTMSDIAATEVKFNAMLETYRQEVLPLCFANYDTFRRGEISSWKDAYFFVDFTLWLIMQKPLRSH